MDEKSMKDDISQEGVNEIEDALEFIADFATRVDGATNDGWQWMSDSMHILPAFVKLPAAVSGAEKIPAQYADMDPEERARLEAIIEKMAFKSEYAELVTEEGLKLVSQMAKFLAIVRMARR